MVPTKNRLAGQTRCLFSIQIHNSGKSFQIDLKLSRGRKTTVRIIIAREADDRVIKNYILYIIAPNINIICQIHYFTRPCNTTPVGCWAVYRNM